MEQKNRLDEIIRVWTTVVFGESMTLVELSESPRLRELSVRQFETLDTLLTSEMCAERPTFKRCVHCPNTEGSLLGCHLVARHINDELDELREVARHAPLAVQQTFSERIRFVEQMFVCPSGSDGSTVGHTPPHRDDQRQAG